MSDVKIGAFEIPETVRLYLTDSPVRVGVNALLEIDLGDLPADLIFDELPDYLGARAQAEATRSDWAIFVHDLWKQIWHPLLDGWTAAEPNAVDKAGHSVTPRSCWDEQGFDLWHERNGTRLYTALQVTPGETTIAFGLEGPNGEMLTDCEGYRWVTKEWDRWLIRSIPGNPTMPSFDLGEVQSFARIAMARIRQELDQ